MDVSTRSRSVLIRWLAAATGLVLLGIGVRFMLVPHQAAASFGIAGIAGDSATALAYVIGLRDIWLALLVLALAAIEDWRGLALWLGFGTAVCFGDAAIAAWSSGRPIPIGFHMSSGGYCGLLSLACWRQHRRSAKA